MDYNQIVEELPDLPERSTYLTALFAETCPLCNNKGKILKNVSQYCPALPQGSQAYIPCPCQRSNQYQ